jgi:hypothetical protein
MSLQLREQASLQTKTQASSHAYPTLARLVRSSKDVEVVDTTFQKLLSARNSSILAHGVDPVGQKTAEKFLQYIDTLVAVPKELRSGARHAGLLAL